MRPLLLITPLFLWNLLHADDAALRDAALRYGLKPVETGVIATDDPAVALGERLFFEPRLSKDGTISCASCHDISGSGADGRPTALGYLGRANPSHLNTPTVLNAIYSKHFFWDGRSSTLSDQAKGPLQAPFEMASTPELVEKRLKNSAEYGSLFEAVYGDDTITFERVVETLEAYEATLVTRGRFDAFLEGDLSALDTREKEGLKLFISYACISCHNGAGLGGQAMRKFPLVHHSAWSTAKHRDIANARHEYEAFMQRLDAIRAYGGFAFTDVPARQAYLDDTLGTETVELLRKGFFNETEPEKAYTMMTEKGCNSCHRVSDFRVDTELLRTGAFPFENRGGFLGKGRPNRFFRVPLLRNIVRTAPYFHNGSVETLEEAIEIMASYQTRVSISKEQVKSIVAFLKAVDAPAP